MICPNCRREFFGGSTCPRCGRPIHTARICPRCGSPAAGNFCSNCGTKVQDDRQYCQPVPVIVDDSSDKSKWAAFFLCLFLGGLGIHRFYVGKVGTGILWLLLFVITAGLWAVAVVVDLILIVMGKFKDKYGLYLR